ncbi:MAG: thioredoxin-disulfide reductase [Methanosarcinaceae archaeon]|nr:thioredoxin-disulfide reductase [Methanosarcinaceae archaeon]
MHDLVIIGGGPAGLSAGIYATRYGLDIIVLEKNEISGQIALTDIVENYPGFTSIKGMELMERFKKHAQDAGVTFQSSEVLNVKNKGTIKIISTDSGELEAKSVIIATGANPRHLGIPGEEEFIGRGVSYCATCDGPFFTNLNVIVVGGGDSAITDALILSKIAKKVTIVHRRDSLRAVKIMQDRAFSANNIEFIWDTVVEEIIGNDGVEKVVLKNVKSGNVKEMPIEGVFIYVGIHPNTGFVEIDKNQSGFIITNDRMETSAAGIYAAGDCRKTLLRQVVTAASDGAVASLAAYEYVAGVRPEQ